MRILLVVNRSSGTFRRLPVDETVAQVAARFAEAGHQVTVEVRGRRDVPALLSWAANRDDCDVVVVGGGDGTILTAVLAGIGRDKPLGVVPLGTLNLFARDIGLPLDPVEAAGRLAGCEIAEIDLAEVNGNPFTVWASLGMHPWMVRRRDRLQRSGLSKWPAMAVAALRAFRRYPMVAVTLMVKGEAVEVNTPVLMVTNNAWREEVPPLSRQTLDRGELVVHVARCRTRLGLLRLAFNALLGRWKTGQLLATYTTQEVRVSARKHRVMVSLDGEVTVLRSPLIFRVCPRALKVLMPSRDEGSRAK